MIITPLPISGLYQVQSEPFRDARGQFARLFCLRELSETGLEMNVVQINHSSTKSVGTVRGMHFQQYPCAEKKIVRCLAGRCFDVAVDLRPDSKTYLKWFGTVLSPDNNKALYIPEGFAHGFQALAPDTEMLYLHSEYYSPEREEGVRHDDPVVKIEWPLPPCDVSQRDMQHPLIDDTFSGVNV